MTDQRITVDIAPSYCYVVRTMKIALSCGGTGGHAIPGVVVAEELRERGHEVIVWLAGKGIESASTRIWAGPVVAVRAGGLPSGLPLVGTFIAGLGLCRAVLECLSIMRRDRPDVLLAMGSYASFGPACAAGILRVPVVAHEGNAVPGRAIEFISRWAKAVAVSFPETERFFKGRRCVHTGFPIRSGMERAQARRVGTGQLNLLVAGGSQGAMRLNEVAVEAACLLKERGTMFSILHLAGPSHESEVRARYAAAGVNAEVRGFMQDIKAAYAVADFAIARAGAGTCFELLAQRVPALLVPFPFAARGHQSANAMAMHRLGVADVIEETDLTADWLANHLDNVRTNSVNLAAMRSAADSVAHVCGKSLLADLVVECGRTTSGATGGAGDGNRTRVTSLGS